MDYVIQDITQSDLSGAKDGDSAEHDADSLNGKCEREGVRALSNDGDREK